MLEGGKLIITSERKKDTLEIAFADTGVGIPSDVLVKVGKPLVTTKAKSMGFGLAICNRIMEAYRGKLSIESDLNKGATVKSELPIARKENKKLHSSLYLLQNSARIENS